MEDTQSGLRRSSRTRYTPVRPDEDISFSVTTLQERRMSHTSASPMPQHEEVSNPSSILSTSVDNPPEARSVSEGLEEQQTSLGSPLAADVEMPASQGSAASQGTVTGVAEDAGKHGAAVE